jgi:hypothetical protein
MSSYQFGCNPRCVCLSEMESKFTLADVVPRRYVSLFKSVELFGAYILV